MTFYEISQAVCAEIYCMPEDDAGDVHTAYAADIMSDVLAFAAPGCVLVTGLRNLQVVRTSDIQDIPCIIFTRGKQPEDDMLAMARSTGICIMSTSLSTFSVCGRLYEKGIRGVDHHD